MGSKTAYIGPPERVQNLIGRHFRALRRGGSCTQKVTGAPLAQDSGGSIAAMTKESGYGYIK
jgi:hypothetical protein